VLPHVVAASGHRLEVLSSYLRRRCLDEADPVFGKPEADTSKISNCTSHAQVVAADRHKNEVVNGCPLDPDLSEGRFLAKVCWAKDEPVLVESDVADWFGREETPPMTTHAIVRANTEARCTSAKDKSTTTPPARAGACFVLLTDSIRQEERAPIRYIEQDIDEARKDPPYGCEPMKSGIAVPELPLIERCERNAGPHIPPWMRESSHDETKAVVDAPVGISPVAAH